MTLANHETGALTEVEAARLEHKERVIERSAGEVAEALMVIRDERLYRAKFTTFEAYCRERWGMTRQHANRQIVAAEVAAALEPMGSKVTERQARELADLRDDPDQMRDVWQQVVDSTDGKPTAAAIREARNPQTPAPEPEGEADDGVGHKLEDGEAAPVAAVEPTGNAPRPPVVGIDGKAYSVPVKRAVPRPAAEKSLNSLLIHAQRAAREADALTADQINRIKPKAGLWTAGLRNAIEALQRLADSLDNQENK